MDPKLTHFLRVIFLVPIDQVKSANQTTQRNQRSRIDNGSQLLASQTRRFKTRKSYKRLRRFKNLRFDTTMRVQNVKMKIAMELAKNLEETLTITG